MSVKIGHAAIDSKGGISGDTAGDNNGGEVCTRSWYNKPWTSVIRPNSATNAEKIAVAMEQACANNKIGYDQNQRTTLYTQAKANNWNISKITTPCECDCSSLVAVCVNAAGIAVSKDMYTGNELELLKATGKFTVYTSSEYVSKPDNLKRGDILLGKGHTVIVLEDALNKNVQWNGVTTTALNVRTGAGAEYPLCSFAPLKKGTVVGVCDSAKASNGVVWYYIKYNNQYGFASSKYIQKTNTTTNNNTNGVDSAASYSGSIAGTYKTTTALNLRAGAGTNKKIQCIIPKDGKVSCYGYYSTLSGVKWYLVTYGQYTGFASSKYLVKQ